MTVVDSGVYAEGRRVGSPADLDQTFELMRSRRAMGWIGLYRPGTDELESVAHEFGLHPLAVEDALAGHQRAKLERYGDSRFVVLRPARYLDDTETVEFGELQLFVGRDFVVTVRHAETEAPRRVRHRLEAHPPLLAKGPRAVLYATLDDVVDEYVPVVAGLQNDIDEIEDQIFGGDPAVTRRIYGLSQEVFGFQRAVQPLIGMLETLVADAGADDPDIELQRLLRDVLDHVIRISERVDGFRATLQNALSVHLTLVGQRQNEEVKKISSWAAILFTPTLVGTVYGMNFDHMPELHWLLGYPMALLLMVLMGVGLYVVFRHRKWL